MARIRHAVCQCVLVCTSVRLLMLLCVFHVTVCVVCARLPCRASVVARAAVLLADDKTQREK